MSALISGIPAGAFDHLLVGLYAVPERQIDSILSMVSRAQVGGMIDEAQAEVLWSAAGHRRQVFGARRRLHQNQRVPDVEILPPKDRRSRALIKRRTWGGSGALPPQLRGRFTPGENAVAAVIRAEVRRNGLCTLSLASIAKSAGLQGTTVVKRFMRQAKKDGLIAVDIRPVKGGRNKTNVISIVSKEWLTWNDLPMAKGIGGTSVSPIQNSGNKSSLLMPSRVAFEGARGLGRMGAPARPSPTRQGLG